MFTEALSYPLHFKDAAYRFCHETGHLEAEYLEARKGPAGKAHFKVLDPDVKATVPQLHQSICSKQRRVCF